MLLGTPRPQQAVRSGIPYVTEVDFEPEVLRAELTVLLHFTSDRSAVCSQMAPELEALSVELQGKVVVRRLDVDKSPMLAQQLRIESLPTFMVFVAGRPVDGVAGIATKKQLRALLEPHLPRAEGAIKPAEAAQLLAQKQVVAVDIREASAFSRAHLPGAVNFPSDTVEQRMAELYMLGLPPMLYCRSGNVAMEIVQRLALEGAELVFLEGGMLAWESNSLPVVKP